MGIIQIGIEHLNYSLEDLKKDPITLMYQAYVKGNELAEKDKEVYNKAKAVFNDLEQRREETINAWNQYREWTTEELSKMYKRLGIKFDEYSWESHYNRENAEEVLKLFEKQGTLSVDEKGRKVVKVGDKVIPLIKSDDTTLYLIRDLMAVLDRK